MINLLITLLISIFIIGSLHYFWNYLKDTYSIKKTKDLVNSQIEKYKKMMDEIQENKGSQTTEYLSDEEKENMNNELMKFVNSIDVQTTIDV